MSISLAPRKLRVLVVEDHPLNRTLTRLILETRGHEVLEATDVSAGREHLRQQPPDLVLMDIQVSGGGGEAFMREIKRDPVLRMVPVVAVTAYAMRGDRERLLAAGFDGYIDKPIDVETFGPTVEGYVPEGQ
jgi:CheY-like chemotaxis protein